MSNLEIAKVVESDTFSSRRSFRRRVASVLVLIFALSLFLPASANAADSSRYDGSPAGGEPRCNGSLWWQDCTYRNLYRNIYYSSMYPNADNVRTAWLMAFAPVTRSTVQRDAQLEYYSARVYDGLLKKPAAARCVRAHIMSYLDTAAKRGNMIAPRANFLKAAEQLSSSIPITANVKIGGKWFLRVVGLKHNGYSAAAHAYLSVVNSVLGDARYLGDQSLAKNWARDTQSNCGLSIA